VQKSRTKPDGAFGGLRVTLTGGHITITTSDGDAVRIRTADGKKTKLVIDAPQHIDVIRSDAKNPAPLRERAAARLGPGEFTAPMACTGGVGGVAGDNSVPLIVRRGDEQAAEAVRRAAAVAAQGLGGCVPTPAVRERLRSRLTELRPPINRGLGVRFDTMA
jgi:hypothetical protein